MITSYIIHTCTIVRIVKGAIGEKTYYYYKIKMRQKEEKLAKNGEKHISTSKHSANHWFAGQNIPQRCINLLLFQRQNEIYKIARCLILSV